MEYPSRFPRRSEPETDARAHDLVLNIYVAREKFIHATKKLNFAENIGLFWDTNRNERPAIFKCIIFIVSFVAACFIFGPLSIVLIPAFVLIGDMRGFPSNLVLDDEGLQFKWCTKQYYVSPLFSWDSIFWADIQQPQYLADKGIEEGKTLVLSIDTSRLQLGQRLWLMRSASQLGRIFLLPFENNNSFERCVFEIPLDAFTRGSDKELIVDLIKHKLGDRLGDRLQVAVESKQIPSFTKLWLDEAQSFRRKSIEPLPVGAVLQDGTFQITERIATGGQAVVYRATDTSVYPERTVVLKEFILPVSAGSDVRNRSFESVKNEALLLSGLSHPGIIGIFDNFVEDHRAYLVLENIEGTTLRDLVHERGPIDEAQTISIALKLCDILDYLHRQSPPVVHRDFTPDNLIMTTGGDVKLLDFNVALQSESTSTKTVVGKHHYIAPEQFRGKPVPQSDLYSLGGTLFFLLTGKDPTSLSVSSLAKEGLPDSKLERVVSNLTQVDLEKRFASIKEVREQLETIL